MSARQYSQQNQEYLRSPSSIDHGNPQVTSFDQPQYQQQLTSQHDTGIPLVPFQPVVDPFYEKAPPETDYRSPTFNPQSNFKDQFHQPSLYSESEPYPNNYHSPVRRIIPEGDSQGFQNWQQPQQRQFQPGDSGPQGTSTAQTSRPSTNRPHLRQSRSISPIKNTRIDANSVPQLTSNSSNYSKPFRTCSQDVVPCATASYLCVDDGNASPRHIRMTTHWLPIRGELADKVNIVIGAIIQPFAPIPIPEITENIVKYSPVRCKECGAYVNPQTRWMSQGRTFKCNMCYEENHTPAYVTDYEGNTLQYISPVDNSGRRLDSVNLPELMYGTVEYVASRTYLKRDENDEQLLVKPSILFAIDVSAKAIRCGLLKSVVFMIGEILEELRQDLDSWGMLQFGLITYDDGLHFHRYTEQGEMCVVNDVDDPFAPWPGSTLLFELRDDERYTRFLTLLDDLPSRFQKNASLPSQQHCVGAVMQVGRDILAKTGGKVVLFQTGIPSVGVGAFHNRSNTKIIGTKMEKTLFRGSVAFWNDLASKATDHSKITVAFDVFVCANETVDLASIAEVTRATGGQIYFYANYQDDLDYDKLYYDLKENITRFTGFDAVMVVRLSKPLEIEEQMGAMTETSNKELILPVVTSDSTFCVRLNNYYDELDSSFPPCIQTAVMYTNIFSETMIKVHTLKLRVANSLVELFRRVDVHAIIKFSICQIAAEMFNPLFEETVRDCGKGLQDACIEIIASYRNECTETADQSQLILPDSLRLLPLFTFSLLKHTLLQEMVQPDVRVAHLLIALSISCKASGPYVYPHM